ncbi:MAG: glycosyl transferase family 1 [Alphaproteobacteria bacterium 64-11]|nr:glycosyltransferase family 4 protein [Alphaproteobacteria bacterium]OJU08113.1 MAG: glycosyl transferase family 1 [Alphaproteobacteria bacterium 64-11]
MAGQASVRHERQAQACGIGLAGRVTTSVLVFSTLYPNAGQPNHGIFVENRLRHTLALGGLCATVLAPRPWFFSGHPRFGRYAAFARIPAHETRHGLDVHHPPYLVLPRLSAITPWLLYRAALHAVRKLMRAGQRFDVIDAHYFYPDGVAAALLGRTLGLPVVITGRGTDLTLIPHSALARRQIQWAAGQASAMITVCEDLRQRLVALGAAPERTIVLRNGVDLDRFSPAGAPPRNERVALLSVGSLIPRKGHELVIGALPGLADCDLTIAGSGPLRAELEALAHRLGVAGRVRFLGEVPHADLPGLYQAADMLVLASQREGWANVLLEAMACGTPVVATNVNGSAEAVCSPAAGLLAGERSIAGIRDAILALSRAMPPRDDTRRHACRFSWFETARANRDLLIAAAAAGRAGRHSPAAAQAARASLMKAVLVPTPV